ncbi:hypothetical protein [Streptomyces sp. CB02115]|uniref:hypothetical protein n=1 Tax=Streptomyces sp. CB02115 TaxID=1703939 RepID=UPI00096226FA|nr:hypothetical protein [Streptomyces sp. CB02115]OKJ46831.1 hypothetical protein AMK28_37235 [Streptomyces sp. CB02115]
METEMGAGVPGVYWERAERRRQKHGTGETRGDGWQRTEEDEHLLRLATRYSTLTLHQAAYACWDGRIEAARRRVRLMTEAGLLHRAADVRWARTVLWPTERGARVACTGLSAPRPPGERILHRLAVADVGITLEAAGHAVLSEREVHAAEAAPGRAAELLAALRAPRVPGGARRGETLAVPVGTRAVHWPDLVTVPPAGQHPIAVEVELTPKGTAALRTILRAYRHAQRRVLYLGTGPVVRQLQGAPGSDGRWLDGVAQDVGLLPAGGPDPGSGGHFRVRPFTAVDPAVARRAALQAARRRGG